MLKAQLDLEGNDDGFSGDFNTLKAYDIPTPGPYTCQHFALSNTVCTAHWVSPPFL
jgi:hypothetical protein